jgi:hypothetical protein
MSLRFGNLGKGLAQLFRSHSLDLVEYRLRDLQDWSRQSKLEYNVPSLSVHHNVTCEMDLRRSTENQDHGKV